MIRSQGRDVICLRFLPKTKSSDAAGRLRRKADSPDLSRVHPNPDEWLAAVLARTPPAPGDGDGRPNGAGAHKRRRGRRMVVALGVVVAVAAVGVLGWFAATAAI